MGSQTFFYEADFSNNRRKKKGITTGSNPIACLTQVIDRLKSPNLEEVDLIPISEGATIAAAPDGN